MSAQKKIEDLTNAWYGADVATAALSLVFVKGLGLFSMFGSAVGLGFSLFITYLIGRRLRAGSSGMRLFLLVWSFLAMVFGALATLKLAGSFLSEWSFRYLVGLAFAGIGLYMHGRSIKTLRDASVKAHCS